MVLPPTDNAQSRGPVALPVCRRILCRCCRKFTSVVMGMPVVVRRGMLMAWDALAWVFALFLLVEVRWEFALSRAQWEWAAAFTLAMVFLQAMIGLLTHTYMGRHRIGSFDEATWLGSFVLLFSVPVGLVVSGFQPNLPRAVVMMVPPTALALMATGRGVARAMLKLGSRQISTGATPVVVYGAGVAGHQVAQLVDGALEPPYRIVGYLDDDPGKRFHRVGGYRILGTGDDLVEVALSRGAKKVIVAISAASPELLHRVSEQCKRAGLELAVIPPVREMIDGRVTLGSLREFNVADLLGRRPIHTDLSQIADYVSGKVVLVTGAGGSIGSELARQLHNLGPSKLVLLDRDESALHAVQLSIYRSGLLDTDDIVLCDIRDRAALEQVFLTHRPEVVFHAAALKHLPMLERFPDEGWKTNVLGSLNVLRCAHQVGVKTLVNISTDKAADATSVLGSTKRLAERLTAWYANEYEVPYLSVRFGNVLGSRGSVLYTFKAQINQGGPVMVTHPEVTRYFMTIPEACELVLQAGAIGRPGDVLVLDMGEPVKIVDVAERLIAESGRDIKIEFTGLRPGEKLHEVLFAGREVGHPSEHPLINQVQVPPIEPADVEIDHPIKGSESSQAATRVNGHDTDKAYLSTGARAR